MPTYQAKFTPTDVSAINIMTFEYQGKFETVPQYREPEQHGLDGNYAIKLGSKSEIISTKIVVLLAAEASILAARNLKGVLIVRETSFSNVRLLTAKRIRGFVPTTTYPSSIVSNAYLYVEMQTEWIQEPV